MCQIGDKFTALHPATMNPESSTIIGCRRDPRRGCLISLEFDDGITIENTAHHFRRFLKLAEYGVKEIANAS